MKQRTSYFGTTLMNLGIKGEQMAMELFWCFPNVTAVEDVRNTPEYQSQDVDFILTTTTKTIKVEVKTDQKMGVSGNVVFEDHRVYTDTGKRNGWSWFSEAEILLVWSPSISTMHLIKFNELRDVMWQYLIDHPTTQPKMIPTDDQCLTYIYLLPDSLVPMRRFQRLGPSIWKEKRD